MTSSSLFKQGVLASRRELVSYDMKKLQSSNVRGGKGDSMTPVFTSEPPTPVTPESSNPILTPSDSDLDTGHCFNCASATLEHCITLLKALAFRQQTKEFVVKQVIFKYRICNKKIMHRWVESQRHM